MTVVYDNDTHEKISELNGAISTFSMRKGETIILDEVPYKINEIEHTLDTHGNYACYKKRSIYVTRKGCCGLH